MYNIKEIQNTILQGDALTELRKIPNECIDMILCSPPYWALRDYGIPEQLGLEKTFQEYIEKLVTIFDQVKRVLKKEGSCWVVIGDTYSGMKQGNTNGCGGSGLTSPNRGKDININDFTFKKEKQSIPDKSLCMIPERFAITMIDRGWILRNKIIWHKRNCMPSSAKDRFTVDYEYVYFFTKSQKYYFETQYETGILERDHHPTPQRDTRLTHKMGGGNTGIPQALQRISRELAETGHTTRIKRSVWTINTAPFSEAHFAVYPEKLCETPIKACCPEYICRKCGKAREKIVEKDGRVSTGHIVPDYKEKIEVAQGNHGNTSCLKTGYKWQYKENGFSDCGCNSGFDSGIVLDPFCGAGTTGLVALKLARRFIGIELNPEYIKIAQKRLEPYLLQTKLI